MHKITVFLTDGRELVFNEVCDFHTLNNKFIIKCADESEVKLPSEIVKSTRVEQMEAQSETFRIDS